MSGTGGAAAVAVLLIGLMIGLTVAQPSLDRALTDLKDARESIATEIVELKNTDMELISTFHNDTTSVLNLTIGNSGSSVMELSDLDVLVNGTYAASGPVGYLYPGQTLTLSVKNVTDLRSVKVVGPWGISVMTSTIGRG
ncbi:MAG: hypothetical protein JXA22_10480 [Candidatus Thermoplasmatota archaeon]|nr:hypothetical protein [Candidatus Thermoplasmatota archaeon]